VTFVLFVSFVVYSMQKVLPVDGLDLILLRLPTAGADGPGLRESGRCRPYRRLCRLHEVPPTFWQSGRHQPLAEAGQQV
jgi:hypothetical protein